MPLNIDWQQILLHLLNFVILFAILYLLLYRPVKRFMGRRAEHYKKMDEEANANLAESERAKAEYAEKLSGPRRRSPETGRQPTEGWISLWTPVRSRLRMRRKRS